MKINGDQFFLFHTKDIIKLLSIWVILSIISEAMSHSFMRPLDTFVIVFLCIFVGRGFSTKTEERDVAPW